MLKSRVPCAVAGVLALTTPFTVFPVANAAEEPRDSLDDVVVVATRSPVELDKIGNAVAVIDQEQIEESQAVVLADLLVTTPGLTFSRNGGPGTTTSVRIRGAESDQTLVLIDGVQINDPSSPGGGFDFSNLLVGDIARVEILRGSQSTLYGSQAIGGVINIVSRENRDQLSGKLQGELGGRNSSQVKASAGALYDKLSFRLGGSRYRTDSVSAFAGGTETDRFSNTTFAGRLGYAFSDDLSVDVRAYHADGQVDTDGFPPPLFVFADDGSYTSSRQLVAYGGLNFDLFEDRLKSRIAYQTTDVDRSTWNRSATTGAATRNGLYQGKNERYEYQGTLAIAEGYQAVFGFQDEEQQMESLAAPTYAELGQKSWYLQLQGEVVRGLTLTGGLRKDDHDAFGSHSTTQLAAAWSLPSGTVLRASWGEGFKAPTIYQLFSDYRNPGLQPETSRGWDAGVEQWLLDRRLMLSATYFERTTRNQIVYTSCPFPITAGSVCALPGHSSFGYYTNVGRTEADGIELQASFAVTESFELSANYTHMQVDDQTPGAATRGQRLLRRPDVTGNLQASYTWPIQLQTSLALRYTGKQYDQDFNSFPARRLFLGGHALVDVRASFPLTERLDLTARVENVFDKPYQTVYEFGTVGRVGYAGLALKF